MKLYEVQEMDKYEEIASCNTFNSYNEALDLYNQIDDEGGFCRLLEVNSDGEELDEIKCNYYIDKGELWQK